MRKTLQVTLAVSVVALAAALVPPGTAEEQASAAKQSQNREFEGRVVKVKRAKSAFVMRSKGGRVQIRVNRRTRYEGLRGLNGLRAGMKVEVNARRSGKGWIALKVERDDADDD